MRLIVLRVSYLFYALQNLTFNSFITQCNVYGDRTRLMYMNFSLAVTRSTWLILRLNGVTELGSKIASLSKH